MAASEKTVTRDPDVEAQSRLLATRRRLLTEYLAQLGTAELPTTADFIVEQTALRDCSDKLETLSTAIHTASDHRLEKQFTTIAAQACESSTPEIALALLQSEEHGFLALLNCKESHLLGRLRFLTEMKDIHRMISTEVDPATHREMTTLFSFIPIGRLRAIIPAEQLAQWLPTEAIKAVVGKVTNMAGAAAGAIVEQLPTSAQTEIGKAANLQRNLWLLIKWQITLPI